MKKRSIDILSDTHKGINRKINKDGIIIINNADFIILGVLDGVSSSPDSDKAVKNVINFIETNYTRYYEKHSFNLTRLIFDVNTVLISSDLNQPYTTCSIVYIPSNIENKIKYLNIGDSRIYAVSNQFIEKLTKDDKDNHHNNIITKYLGSNTLEENDFKEYDYRGDAMKFLICTDGFYNLFENNIDLLIELHKKLNIKPSFYINYNLNKMLNNKNTDDATYIFARLSHV